MRMAGKTSKIINLNPQGYLVKEDVALIAMAQGDDKDGLSKRDVDIYVRKNRSLPHIPGFTEKDSKQTKKSFLSAASRYASWKADYIHLWQHFDVVGIDEQQAKELYQISYDAAGLDIPASELLDIANRPGIVLLDACDQLATLRTYVLLKEADAMSEEDKLRISPTFPDFIDTITGRIYDGKLITHEPQDICSSTSLVNVAGTAQGAKQFTIRANVKKCSAWVRYVTMHEAYHVYNSIVTGGMDPGDEVSVHHVSMNYFIGITDGKGFRHRPNTNLFDYDIPAAGSCEGSLKDGLRKTLAVYPQEQVDAILEIVDDISAYPKGTSRYRHAFWDSCYSASLEDMVYEQGYYDAHRKQLEEMYKLMSKSPARTGMLKELKRFLEAQVQIDRMKSRNELVISDKVLADMREQFIFEAPEDFSGYKHVRGRYIRPDGKVFSLHEMVMYYACLRLKHPEQAEGMLDVVLNAWQGYLDAKLEENKLPTRE